MASCASHPIRFQDSLIINICGMNKVILVFFHGDSNQAKVAPGTTTLIPLSDHYQSFLFI